MKKFLLTLALALFFSAPAMAAAQINVYNTGDAAQYSANTPPSPNYVNAYALAANTLKTVTWPTGATYVVFTCTATFWFSLNSSFTIPVADVTNGTSGQINPSKLRKGTETTFYLESTTAQVCSAAYYSGTF